MFMELEINGKNQNETVNNKHLHPTDPSGAVARTPGKTAHPEAPSPWSKAGRHFAFGIVWPWKWVSASQNSYHFISHKWKQARFVQLVFSPRRLGPSSCGA